MYKVQAQGTSVVVQWLELHASTAGGTGSILGQGTKIPWVTCAKKEKKQQSSVNLGSRFLGCTERAWPQLET